MTISQEDELTALRVIGRIVADTLQQMIARAEPGMTTQELDDIGRQHLEGEGAISAPQQCYDFPGTTCISVNETIAHGIPDQRMLQDGDLINIDVSASKNGFFGDTGASFQLGKRQHPMLARLCRDGRQAMQIGIDAAVAGQPLAGIGRKIERYASQRGYTLIRNLASHGIGRALHEEPGEIPTWASRREKRRITAGMVMTVEPFLSTGGVWADQGEDGWSLFSQPSAPVVQYEHTIVATAGQPIILTLPS